MLQTGHYRTQDGKIAHIRHIDGNSAYGSIEGAGLASWHVATGLNPHTTAYSLVQSAPPPLSKTVAAVSLKNIYPKVTQAGVSPWTWYDRQGYSGPISLVVHATSGPGEAIDTYNYFMGDEAGACSTLVIGRKGEVYQCADPTWAASANCCPSAHVGDWWPRGVNGNFYTVSIEIQKAPGNQELCSFSQFQAVCEVVDWLCSICSINRVYAHDKTGGIITHSDFDPANRPGNSDPGPFDMIGLLNYIGKKPMAELKGYPVINQRMSPTTDNQPDENKEMNCVASNVCAALWYYRPDYRGKIWPDTLKDAVLGQGVVGPTSIERFIAYIHDTYRLAITPYRNTSDIGLINQAHRWIQASQPAIFTETDPYSNDPNLWHVGTFFKEIVGGLALMDSYGGHIVNNTDLYWATVAQSGTIWTVTKDMITLATPGVSLFFDSVAAHPGWWHLKNKKDSSGNDIFLHGAILDYYAAWPSTGAAGLTEFGLPLTNEILYERDAKGNVIYCMQVFERGAIAYDPQRKHDNPVGSVGSCYRVHIDSAEVKKVLL